MFCCRGSTAGPAHRANKIHGHNYTKSPSGDSTTTSAARNCWDDYCSQHQPGGVVADAAGLVAERLQDGGRGCQAREDTVDEIAAVCKGDCLEWTDEESVIEPIEPPARVEELMHRSGDARPCDCLGPIALLEIDVGQNDSRKPQDGRNHKQGGLGGMVSTAPLTRGPERA